MLLRKTEAIGLWGAANDSAHKGLMSFALLMTWLNLVLFDQKR